MNKESYLESLKQCISGLSKQEVDDAIEYYREYFEDAGVENEQKVIEELGTPAQLARKIESDHNDNLNAQANMQYDGSGNSKKSQNVLIIVLLVISCPIWIPLLLAVAAVAFGLIVAAAAIVFALVVVGVACVLAGVIATVSALTLIAIDWSTSLFVIGMGLVSLALGLLWTLLMVSMMQGIAGLISKKARKRAEVE